MTGATDHDPDVAPDRASFKTALNTARDQIIQATGVIADTIIDLMGVIGRAVLTDPLPERRTRISPRVVKRAISKHRAKGVIDRTNHKASITISLGFTALGLAGRPANTSARIDHTRRTTNPGLTSAAAPR
jgi:hypothetical protein